MGFPDLASAADTLLNDMIGQDPAPDVSPGFFPLDTRRVETLTGAIPVEIYD